MVAKSKSVKTTELANWIASIKVKKLNFKCLKRKDLFIEAVLNKSLAKAEMELRQKQQERRQRWQLLKSSWGISNKIDSDSCSKIDWDNKAFEEFNSSLDEFMAELKVVNSVQR